MYIRNTNTTTRQLYNEALLEEPVEFNENGVARVTADVGETLIDHYESIVLEKEETSSSTASDESNGAVEVEDEPEETDT